MGVTSTDSRMSVVTFNSALLSCCTPPPPRPPPGIFQRKVFAFHLRLILVHLRLILVPRTPSWCWNGRGTRVEVGGRRGVEGCTEAGAINHVSLTGETGERRHRSPAACHRSACNERIRADGRRSQPFIWRSRRSRRPSAGVTHLSAVRLKLLPAGSFIPGFESDRGEEQLFSSAKTEMQLQ